MVDSPLTAIGMVVVLGVAVVGWGVLPFMREAKRIADRANAPSTTLEVSAPPMISSAPPSPPASRPSSMSPAAWKRPALLFVALGCLALAISPKDAAEPIHKGAFLWIEGEDATVKNVKSHPWWYDRVKRDKLSGGKWLHHFDEKVEGTAEYEVKAPLRGDYHFWLHANPVAARLSYQLDKGPGCSSTRWTRRLATSSTSPPTASPTFASSAGYPSVSSPSTRARTPSASSSTAPPSTTAASTSSSSPPSRSPPRASSARFRRRFGPVRFDIAGTWAFTPANDNFKDRSPIDLRYLNEKVAGAKGFVRLSADGSGFVLGDGTPVRFWAVNDTVYRKSDAELQHHARFLAKQGVNMVRMHGSFTPRASAAASPTSTGPSSSGPGAWWRP